MEQLQEAEAELQQTTPATSADHAAGCADGSVANAESSAGAGQKRSAMQKATPASTPDRSPRAKQQQTAQGEGVTTRKVSMKTRCHRTAYAAESRYQEYQWHQEYLQTDAKGYSFVTSQHVLLMAVQPNKATAEWVAVAKPGKPLVSAIQQQCAKQSCCVCAS